VILAETALYAESGGQVADKGVIVGPGYRARGARRAEARRGLISHTVEVTSGEVGVGQPATSVVDAANRRPRARRTRRRTSCTPRCATPRQDATQAGSLNRAGYMRFELHLGVSRSQHATKSEIEEIANNAVRDNLEVTTRVLSLERREEPSEPWP
jgi:alanyl-tRNA synthetase